MHTTVYLNDMSASFTSVHCTPRAIHLTPRSIFSMMLGFMCGPMSNRSATLLYHKVRHMNTRFLDCLDCLDLFGFD